MKATKEQRELFKNYILSCIDLSGYEEYNGLQMSEKERLKTVWALFQKEYCFENNLKYYGSIQKTFENWLMGLPSCFNIDFENYKILELGRKWGILITPDKTNMPSNLNKLIERKEDTFLLQWWARVFMAFTIMMNAKESTRMPYKRKTVDEYEILGDYGQGFECVTSEDTRKEAKQRLKEYRENEPGTRFKCVKKRVKIETAKI